MKVSIVIPVLNEERTVASTLEALTRLAPDEIVVVVSAHEIMWID